MKNILALSVILLTLVGGALSAQAMENGTAGSVTTEKANPFGIHYPTTHNNSFGIHYPELP